jgi:hypothetical protein
VDGLGNSDSIAVTVRLEAEPPAVPPVVIISTSHTATPTATTQTAGAVMGGSGPTPTTRPTTNSGSVTFGSVETDGEAAPQAEGSPNLLWGLGALGLIGAVTAAVLEERRKRKEEEARQLAEAQAKAAALNAAEEQMRVGINNLQNSPNFMLTHKEEISKEKGIKNLDNGIKSAVSVSTISLMKDISNENTSSKNPMAEEKTLNQEDNLKDISSIVNYKTLHLDYEPLYQYNKFLSGLPGNMACGFIVAAFGDVSAAFAIARIAGRLLGIDPSILWNDSGVQPSILEAAVREYYDQFNRSVICQEEISVEEIDRLCHEGEYAVIIDIGMFQDLNNGNYGFGNVNVPENYNSFAHFARVIDVRGGQVVLENTLDSNGAPFVIDIEVFENAINDPEHYDVDATDVETVNNWIMMIEEP